MSKTVVKSKEQVQREVLEAEIGSFNNLMNSLGDGAMSIGIVANTLVSKHADKLTDDTNEALADYYIAIRKLYSKGIQLKEEEK